MIKKLFLFALLFSVFAAVSCSHNETGSGIEDKYRNTKYSGSIGGTPSTLMVDSFGNVILGDTYYQASNIRNEGNGKYSSISGDNIITLEFTKLLVYVVIEQSNGVKRVGTLLKY